MAKKPEQNGTAKSGSEYKAIKREFARRLQKVMLEKGWNQSELARQTALQMPNRRFGRDNISKYLMTGKHGTLPSPLQLVALAKALRVPPEDLLPTDRTRLLSSHMEETEGFLVKQVDEDTMHIRINQRLPKGVAMKIVALLGAAGDT